MLGNPFLTSLIMDVPLKKTQNPQGPGMGSVGRALGDVHFKSQHRGGGGGGRSAKNFRVIFGYLASSGSAWAMWDPVSEEEDEGETPLYKWIRLQVTVLEM